MSIYIYIIFSSLALSVSLPPQLNLHFSLSLSHIFSVSLFLRCFVIGIGGQTPRVPMISPSIPFTFDKLKNPYQSGVVG